MGYEHASAHRRNKEISELSICAKKKIQKAPSKQWDELDLSHLRKVHNLPPCGRVTSKIQRLNICPISSLLKVRRCFVSQLIFVRNKGQAACLVFPGKRLGDSGDSRGHMGRAEPASLGSCQPGKPWEWLLLGSRALLWPFLLLVEKALYRIRTIGQLRLEKTSKIIDSSH